MSVKVAKYKYYSDGNNLPELILAVVKNCSVKTLQLQKLQYIQINLIA